MLGLHQLHFKAQKTILNHSWGIAMMLFISANTKKPTADELSVFYRQFLDDNFKEQMEFTK